MPLCVRLGDTSTHGGEVVTGAAKWDCEGDGKMIARVGDILNCPIHGPNPIVTGSPNWKCEDAAIARDGDTTLCGAALISGAEKWDVN